MWRRVEIGALTGVLAGVVFGLMMELLPAPAPDGGHISMILFTAQAMHARSPVIGWIAYLVYGALIGGAFGGLLRGEALDEGPALLWGGVYGLGWWILAGLVLVPGLLGRMPFSPGAVDAIRPIALALLAGHLLYGLLLGAVFPLIDERFTRRAAPG